jgi:hypothetical protein
MIHLYLFTQPNEPVELLIYYELPHRGTKCITYIELTVYSAIKEHKKSAFLARLVILSLSWESVLLPDRPHTDPDERNYYIQLFSYIFTRVKHDPSTNRQEYIAC